MLSNARTLPWPKFVVIRDTYGINATGKFPTMLAHTIDYISPLYCPATCNLYGSGSSVVCAVLCKVHSPRNERSIAAGLRSILLAFAVMSLLHSLAQDCAVLNVKLHQLKRKEAAGRILHVLGRAQHASLARTLRTWVVGATNDAHSKKARCTLV